MEQLKDYIKCGGLKWALQNAGTDAENPNGKLYTFEEALTLENDLWKRPTLKEQHRFIAKTHQIFDEERELMIFVDRNTGARLELPAVGYRYYTDGSLYYAGTYGNYWSSVQYNTNSARNMYFSSSGVDPNDYSNKQYGFSVRCVRR